MTNLVIKFLTVSNCPAKEFALWMSERRKLLNITLDTLEARTGIKKQHLSTLERALPHPLTGKPVIPRRPTVEKIAKGLETPVHIALTAAGYAANDVSSEYILEFDESLKVKFDGAEHWTKKDWEDAKAQMKFVIELIESRHREEKKE